MILTGSEIKKQVENGSIIINPFSDLQVNPNSYDFRLGEYLMVYKSETLDPKIRPETELIQIPESGFKLYPDKIYLAHTKEIMGSTNFVPIIKGKSSIARLGIFIHITADLIDIGSINQWTLQLHVVEPAVIYPNMLIGQVTFWVVKGDIVLYSGKYQGSNGPVESKIFEDFK